MDNVINMISVFVFLWGMAIFAAMTWIARGLEEIRDAIRDLREGR